MKILDLKVFPSEKETITVYEENDIYGGCHLYTINNCLGFEEGKTQYTHSSQTIQFVKKLDDGKIIAGLQSEQLALVMLDRAKKLNSRFPSEQNQKMIEGLEMFLEACKERVEDRIERGVMGELKK